ncbi:MAG: DEAD/DEAH box helicase [Duncaniella sp.]|nr:DEAD/DEAH box helicase [Duncaniella sp.]
METSFLAGLSRHLQRQSMPQETLTSPTEIFFSITRADDGSAWLGVVDGSMEPVPVPDYHNYSGATAQMLRAFSQVRGDSRFEITWEQHDSESVSLAKHPTLIYQLVRCDNIVDGERGSRVTVSDDTAVLTLNLERTGRDSSDAGSDAPGSAKGDYYEAFWTLDTPVRDGGYDRRRDGWYMLTDCFALSSGVIYPVDSVGDNFAQLRFFESIIPAAMAESFLSVAYSYLDRFALACDDRRVETLPEPALMQPALVIERVHPDLTLHLRVTSALRGFDEMMVRQFDLSRVVSLAVDGKVSVRPLERRDRSKDIARVRDLLVQYAPTRRQGREVYLDGDTFIIPAEVASPFLLGALPKLVNDYLLLGADRLKGYKIKAVKPRLNFNISSGIDFLEGDFTVQMGEENFNLGKLIEQYRRDKYITLRDGTRAVLDQAYMRRLERMFGDKRNAGRKVRLSYFDLPDIEDLTSERLDSALFSRQRELYEGFNALASLPPVAPEVNATLRKYQQDGVKWIKYLYDNNMGGCLADDMGLGKTLQTISVLSGIYPAEPSPTLIVMPRSLLFNWLKEIERFCPRLTTYVYYQGTRDLDEALRHNVILTTYAMVRNDIEKFSRPEFHYIILDESQNIKNITAQVTRAAYMLKGRHRLALSGTPVENNLSELYSLFRFLNPGMLGDLEDFNRRYANPIQREDDREAMASLRRRIYPFMLRRLKKDVLTELPDRIDKRLFIDMERPQAEYYEQRRRYYLEKIHGSIKRAGVAKSQFMMLQALTELRRIASVPESLTDGEITSSKLEALMESLGDAVFSGHKCVVFFNYVAGLELAAEQLSAMGVSYETMTGATTDRRRVVERFDRDPSCMVLLMTLKTGGVGLNLTVADTVFIFEPWWNKAAEEQAINRLHRFGQKAKVLSYSLITRSTIEEKILELQEKKTALYEQLISSDGASPKHLSAEDIDFLLK